MLHDNPNKLSILLLSSPPPTQEKLYCINILPIEKALVAIFFAQRKIRGKSHTFLFFSVFLFFQFSFPFFFSDRYWVPSIFLPYLSELFPPIFIFNSAFFRVPSIAVYSLFQFTFLLQCTYRQCIQLRLGFRRKYFFSQYFIQVTPSQTF